MIKQIIITGLFLGFSLTMTAQSVRREISAKDTITDATAAFPEDVERNYDQLLTQWGEKKKSASNCTFETEQFVTYPDSVYINRLYSLPTQMELSFNPVVKKFIEMYAGRHKQVGHMLGQGKYYFPLFEQALDKEGLPLELKYLPVIESALNPVARSRVGATGLWQFMAGTGKMYNLEINSLVDERSDPIRSTQAAVKYLKDLYKTYGDWNLVIAAYNCGPGNVNKAMRRSGGQTDYWAIYPYLPRETRTYVPIFVAATYIMNYYDQHNICPADGSFPAVMDTLMISKNVHFEQISDMIGVPVDELRGFNPQFKNDIIPGTFKPYALNLPINKITAFIDKQDAIYEHRAAELLTHRKVAGLDVVSSGGGRSGGRFATHKVKRGETLGGVARRYGVSVAQMKKWNGLKSNSISVGRTLRVSNPMPAAPKKVEEAKPKVELAVNTTPKTIEPKERVVQEVQTSEIEVSSNGVYKLVETKRSEPITTYYKVKRGDNLAAIAQKQQVSVSELKNWNRLKTSKLTAGKSLKIVKHKDIVVVDTIHVAEPQLSNLNFKSSYSADLLDEYIKKQEKDGTHFPRVKLGSDGNDDTLERMHINDSRLIYHKVRIGETIPQIAARYNVSKDDIISWNKLSSNIAKVGQRLMIYLPEAAENVSAKKDA